MWWNYPFMKSKTISMWLCLFQHPSRRTLPCFGYPHVQLHTDIINFCVFPIRKQCPCDFAFQVEPYHVLVALAFNCIRILSICYVFPVREKIYLYWNISNKLWLTGILIHGALLMLPHWQFIRFFCILTVLALPWYLQDKWNKGVWISQLRNSFSVTVITGKLSLW